MHCENCGLELQHGDWPFCPHGSGTNIVRGDEIDERIEHGLCWDDGSPRRFTSRTEKQRALEAKGLIEWVEHVGDPGSDKSSHTVRWVSAPVISEEERLAQWYATADPALADLARQQK